MHAAARGVPISYVCNLTIVFRIQNGGPGRTWAIPQWCKQGVNTYQYFSRWTALIITVSIAYMGSFTRPSLSHIG